MPLVNCLAKPELQGLDSGDVSRIQELVARYEADGQTPARAEQSAVQAILSDVYQERASISSQVVAKGGLPPSRTAVENAATTVRPGGLSSGQTRAITNQFIEPFKQVGIQNVRVINSGQVQGITGQAVPEGKIVKGFLLNDTAYVVHDNLQSQADVETALAHEVVGHLGINNIMSGEQWASLKKEYQAYKSAGNQAFNDLVSEVNRRYNNPGIDTEVKEALALMAEQRNRRGPIEKLYKKAVSLVVEGLRKLGVIRGQFMQAQMDRLLDRSESFLRSEPQAEGIIDRAMEPQFAQNDNLYHQIPLDYIVESKGAIPEKPSVLKALNPKNQVAQYERLSNLASSHPDPLKSPRSWLKMERELLADNRTPPPPYRLIRLVNDTDKWAADHSRLSQQQIDAAAEGFKIVEEMNKHYESGTPTEHDTGKLMLWGMLSRMLSAHPHESAFLDAVLYEEDSKGDSLDNFIQTAVDREWTDADVKAYLDWAGRVIPEFSPGKQGTSNLNDFGKIFLKKLSKRNPEDGRSQLSHLHDLFSDRTISSADVRRRFYGLGEGLGIKNKVLSFALLMSGRQDVVILDRIQINSMWDAGRYGKLIYDDVANLFDEAHGLARYEALERSLMSRIDEMYQKVGRPEDSSIGRYHWESWVLNSGQVVSHPTMEGIVDYLSGKKDPFYDVGAPEGRYHTYSYGSVYARDADGSYIMYPQSDGTVHRFSLKEFKDFLDEVKKPKNGVIPKGFSVKMFREAGFPWYESEEVNRNELDNLVERYSQGQLSPEKADTEREAADVAGRDGDTSQLTPRQIRSRTLASQRRRREESGSPTKSHGRRDNPKVGIAGVLAEYTPDADTSEAYLSSGISTAPLYELSNDNSEEFDQAIRTFKESGVNPFSAAVYVYDETDDVQYSDMRLFLTEDKKAGFAIKPDGDIVSVFNGGTERGLGHNMIELAVQEGGTKLDNFDTELSEIYGANGFVVVDRQPWNEEYAPPDWDKEVFKDYNNGEPDVVFMEYQGAQEDARPQKDAGAQFSMDDVNEIEQEEQASAARKGLPMDRSARLMRAEFMGFDTDITYYHGTPKAEDVAKDRKFKDRKGTGRGIFFTPAADMSNNFVGVTGIVETPQGDQFLNTPGVFPVYLRPGKVFDFRNPEHVRKVVSIMALKFGDKGGAWTNLYDPINRQNVEDDIASGFWEHIEDLAVQDAIKELGFESFYVKEEDDAMSPVNISVFSPNQIRSVNAAFDIERMEEDDVLYSMEDDPDMDVFEDEPAEMQASEHYDFQPSRDIDVMPQREANEVVSRDATGRRILAKNLTVDDGDLVGVRLNLNVFKSTGIAVQAVHKGTTKGGHKQNKGFWNGEVLTYAPAVSLKNAYFNVQQKARDGIATGDNKMPMASVDGEYATNPNPSFGGIEVRFNPKDVRFFTDMDGRPIRYAEEVTIHGTRAYASGQIEYYKRDTAPERYSDAPSDVQFSMFSRDPNDDPEFTEEEAKAINETQAYYKSPGASSIERFRSATDRAGTKILQKIFDPAASVRTILKDERLYRITDLAQSVSGPMQAIAQYGRPFWKDDVIQVDTKQKSFQQILAPLGSDAEVKKFLSWIIAERASNLKKENREILLTDEHIRIFKNFHRQNRALYDSVWKEFQGMQNAIYDIAVKAGNLSQEQAEVYKNSFYLPFYRELEEVSEGQQGSRFGGKSGKLVEQELFRRLKGSEKRIEDPLENILLNWHHVLGAAKRNDAGKRILQAAEDLGLSQKIDQRDAKKDPNATYVWEDGKRQWYTVDDSTEGRLLMETLGALNYDMGPWEKFAAGLAPFKHYLTWGVTVDPEFKVANFIRDTITAIGVADMSASPRKNIMDGWKATKDMTDVKAQMLASGAIFSDSGFIHGGDPDAIRYLIGSKGVDRRSILDTPEKMLDFVKAGEFLSLPRSLYRNYQDFGVRLENVNRAANFVQAMEDEGKTMLDAAYESRDHLAFDRMGTWRFARFMARTVPFLNARAQGLYKFGRAATDENQRKRFGATATAYAMASAALYLSMADDEDYKAAEDWERDTYHLFKLQPVAEAMGLDKETLFRIPRAFEFGAIGTLAERALEQATNDEVNGALFLQRVGHMLTHTFSIQAPAAFTPALELTANRSFFTDRPIESIYQRSNLPPEERGSAANTALAQYMSSAMAAVVPESLSESLVLSPPQIDHLARGYLAFVGDSAMKATDWAIKKAGDNPPPAANISEWLPPVARFVRNPDAPSSTKYSSLFYDRREKINKIKGTVDKALRENNVEKAERIWEENAELLELHRYYNRAARYMSEINGEIRMIGADKELSSGEKREQIDELKREKAALMYEIHEETRGVFDDGYNPRVFRP